MGYWVGKHDWDGGLGHWPNIKTFEEFQQSLQCSGDSPRFRASVSLLRLQPDIALSTLNTTQYLTKWKESLESADFSKCQNSFAGAHQFFKLQKLQTI